MGIDALVLLALPAVAGLVLAHVLAGAGVVHAVRMSRQGDSVRRVLGGFRMDRRALSYVLLALLLAGIVLSHLFFGAQLRPH